MNIIKLIIMNIIKFPDLIFKAVRVGLVGVWSELTNPRDYFRKQPPKTIADFRAFMEPQVWKEESDDPWENMEKVSLWVPLLEGKLIMSIQAGSIGSYCTPRRKLAEGEDPSIFTEVEIALLVEEPGKEFGQGRFLNPKIEKDSPFYGESWTVAWSSDDDVAAYVEVNDVLDVLENIDPNWANDMKEFDWSRYWANS